MPPDLPDFYESNLALLAKNHPHIWKLLTDPLPEPEGEIVAAPNGCPNLWTHDQEGNRISLHIPEDPQSEVAQFLGMVDENFSGVVTLTGMGLGYAPLALIQQRRNLRHLAIFEPSAGIFLQAIGPFEDNQNLTRVANIALAQQLATRTLLATRRPRRDLGNFGPADNAGFAAQ